MKRLLLVAALVASCSSVPVAPPARVAAPAISPSAPVVTPGTGLETAVKAALARAEAEVTYRWTDGRDVRADVARLNDVFADPSVPGALYLASWQWQTQSSGRSGAVTVKFTYRTGAKTQAAMEAVEAKINEVLAQVLKPGQSDFDIELAIHDWLVNHARYDEAHYATNTVPGDEYTPYGVLIKGTGVCESYTTAFYLLARRAGLGVRILSGQAGGAHSWNQVKIGGQWYHLDVTWDDPVGSGDRLDHTYFNLDDDLIARVHDWDRAEAQACTATADNWFVRQKLMCATVAEFQAVAKGALQTKQVSVLRRIAQFNPATFDNAIANALKAAAQGIGRSVRWSFSTDAQLGVVEVRFS